MRLGIIGGGQLAQMIAIAAKPLGISTIVLDPSKQAPAQSDAEHICGDYDDSKALEILFKEIDCLTYEFENVPLKALESIPPSLEVHPAPIALSTAQDRLVEKQTFNSLGIQTASFCKVDSFEELVEAAKKLGLPAVLKTRRMGYDGKGQTVIKEESELKPAFDLLGSAPLILEAFIPFSRELSIIGVRNKKGETKHYPLVENIHKEGILRTTIAPASDVPSSTENRAKSWFNTLAQHLDYVGVFCIELFDCNGELKANEFAPRVHNSGHWSIEGAACSQFENHVRAVLDLELGDTNTVCPSVMVNIIGQFPDRSQLEAVGSSHVHDYNKEAKNGRKLGHVTICEKSPEQLQEKRAIIESICSA